MQDTTKLEKTIAFLRQRGGDSTLIEVKSATAGIPNVKATLSAFSNMPTGGTIIFGLNEPHFHATGISDIAALEAAIAAQARSAIEPAAQLSFTTQRFEGQEILLCRVHSLPLEFRPARYRGTAYLRQGDGDYAMSTQELLHLETVKTQSLARKRPDSEPITGTSIDNLDRDLLAKYVQSARRRSPRLAAVSELELLERTGILVPADPSCASPPDTTPDGQTPQQMCLSLAGLYALGEYPQQHLPSLSITAAVQLGAESNRRTRDLAHFDGPLPVLLDSAMDWVSRNTTSGIYYDTSGHAHDVQEIPMVAVRELIANALVHRSLFPITDSKRVEIRLLGNKLVVTSPGGLWGVSSDQLGKPDGKSAVNITLYDISKDTRTQDSSRVIEGEGGGIRAAQQAAHAHGWGLRFYDSTIRFTAILERNPTPGNDGHESTGVAAANPLSTTPSGSAHSSPQSLREVSPQAPKQRPKNNRRDRERAILSIFDAAPSETYSLSEISEILGVTEHQARYSINKLRDRQQVKLIGGATPAAIYRRLINEPARECST